MDHSKKYGQKGYGFSWMDLDGPGWTWMDLDGPGWTWMDLGGPRWSWMMVIKIAEKEGVFIRKVHLK